MRVDGVQRGNLIDDQPIVLAEFSLELADERVQRLLRRDEAARARSAEQVRYRGGGETR